MQTMDQANPFLSIILPAYNEEERLPNTLEAIDRFISTQNYPIEVIIAENASTDRTLRIAREYCSKHAFASVYHLTTPGKGGAVKTGMLQAKGAYRFICDVDLSMPLAEIPRFIPPQLSEVDIAIASREAPGSVRYHEPEYRHLVGRIFNTMVRWLALPRLQDTQCGFKCFRAEVAEVLFPLQTINGWTFDVEILAVAFRKGYRIQELPIPWYYHPHSKVNVFKDSFRMARDLLIVRRNLRRGLYDHPV